MTDHELLEALPRGSSVAEIRPIATRALDGGDDDSREFLREQLQNEAQRAHEPRAPIAGKVSSSRAFWLPRRAASRWALL